MESKRRVISLLVDNQSGVLARVSNLFCRRGFNIDSLTVSATNDPAVSRITVDVYKRQGVDTIFGYPGGAVLNLYDELYKNSDRIHHVPVSYTHLDVYKRQCPCRTVP